MSISELELHKLLHKVHIPGINEQTKLESPLLSKLETLTDGVVKVGVEKLEYHFNAKLGPGHSVQSGWEKDAYPERSAGRHVEARIRLRKLQATAETTPEADFRSEGEKAAYISSLDEEMSDVARQIGAYEARQLTGLGKGKIVQCGTTSSSNNVNVACDSTQFLTFEIGQVIDIGTVGSPATVASERVIEDFAQTSSTTATVTISGAAVTTSSSHFLFFHNSGGASVWADKEVSSLDQIISDQVWAEVDSDDNPEWKGSVLGNGGTPRTLTPQLAQSVKDHVRRTRKSNRNPDTLVVGPGLFNAAANQFLSNYRYASRNEQKDITVDVESLDFAGMEFFKDDYIRPNRAYALNLKAPEGLRRVAKTAGVEEVSPGWYTVPGYDYRKLHLRHYRENVTRQRNLHALVTDLAE